MGGVGGEVEGEMAERSLTHEGSSGDAHIPIQSSFRIIWLDMLPSLSLLKITRLRVGRSGRRVVMVADHSRRWRVHVGHRRCR